MFKKNEDKKIKKKQKKEAEKKKEDKKAVQEWMPIFDVDGGMKRRDDFLVMALEVIPKNIDLLSRNERKRIIANLHEIINGQQEYLSWVSLGRPVDLDQYLNNLEQKVKNTDDLVRKKILNIYIKQAVSMASSGETLERKFYIVIIEDQKIEHARQELENRIRELQSNLQAADLKSEICEDKELINLLFIFTHPTQAAFERTPEYLSPYLPTQYEGGR